jgi:hypothetical protein
MGFLRKLFGPSRDEIWSELAEEIGASFDAGGMFGRSVVRAQTRNWIVTLDTFTVSTGKSSATFTRMRAPYVNRDGFEFHVHRKGLFEGVAMKLGAQDIEVGIPIFDDDFIIKGNDVTKVRCFFHNYRIRDLLEEQPEVMFEVKDDEGWFGTSFPDEVDELYFVARGVITDLDRLKGLFALFAETLDELCRMGSAYENEPDVVV